MSRISHKKNPDTHAVDKGPTDTPSCSFEEMVSLTSSNSSEGAATKNKSFPAASLLASPSKGSKKSAAGESNNPLDRLQNQISSSVGATGTDKLGLKPSFALIASGLAILTLVFVKSAGSTSSANEHNFMNRPFPTHGSSFGKYNLGHRPKADEEGGDGGDDNNDKGLNVEMAALIKQYEQYLPEQNIGTNAVRSLSPQNILNLRGHYLHDEHRSPYASHLYDKPEEELQAIQDAYVKKMDKIRKEWGAWSFVDPLKEQYGPHGKGRPVTDFAGVPYKDLKAEQFVKGSWQTDQEYVTAFITEAKALVNRVKEAIYAEYGHPAQKKDGTPLSDEELAKREEYFRLITEEFKLCKGKPIAKDDTNSCKKSTKPMPGIGYWRKEAFDELSKKLLHSMLTNDEFYVVLGGHSSAAGHGNNFMQSKMMQFHYLMEPIFDRLGMRLVSRNMAQGGVGTLGSAMGGADIYGEADLMIWDSKMTEREAGAHDLFNRQAILSGERVPVLLMPNMYDIEEQTDMLYTWGDGDTVSTHYDVETGFLEKTKDEEHAQTMPFATRYMNCESGSGDLCKDNKYNSYCWVRRSDYNPSDDRKIDKKVGGQASWHPGNRVHQLIARKWSLIVLYALENALQIYQAGMEENGIPLADKFWHVGSEYEEIRHKLRSHVPKSDEDVSKCEELLQNFPIVCKVAMHAFTEWTPHVLPEERSLRAILKSGPSGYLPVLNKVNEYDGFDLLPPQWDIPEGEIDVHAVAIVTTSSPSPNDADINSPPMNSASASESPPVKKEEREPNEARNRSLRVARLRANLERLDMDGQQLIPIRPARQNRRILADASDEVIPGEGWAYGGGRSGFCDGSFQSECQRSSDSKCPGSGHNDGRSGLVGDALSGWLVFEVPNVKEGIIILRLEAWRHANSNERTEGWTEVNNGLKEVQGDDTKGDNDGNTNGNGRQLNIPENDFFFDYAINGVIKTMDYDEFMSYKPTVGQNMSLWPIMLPDKKSIDEQDEDYQGETVEVAIRLRSTAGREATVQVSHLYYA